MVVHDPSDPDPLAIFTAPPHNETHAEKAAREKREAEAQRINDQIDDELRLGRVRSRKQEQTVLVLGQSGSGKYTLIKESLILFRSTPCSSADKERAFWRALLRLNLVQSVNRILTALRDANLDHVRGDLPFSDKHDLLRLRLRPLASVEDDLKRLLGVKAEPNSPWIPRKFHTFYTDDVEICHKTIKHDGMGSGDITEVIMGCKNDITTLWEDHVVREMLQQTTTSTAYAYAHKIFKGMNLKL